MSKILVTGGFGFLGSKLVLKLLENNYKVVIIEKSFADDFRVKDILDKVSIYYEDNNELDKIFIDNEIVGIIHAATDYGRKSSISEIIKNNVLFPLKLVELGKNNDLDFFINVDSYFNKNDISLSYLGKYVVTKNHLEEWLKLIKDFKIYNLKLEHIYGHDDSLNKFVPMIIYKLKNNAKKIELTEGNQKRDFIYIDDVVELFLEIIKKNKEMETKFYDIEVGCGVSISIKEFVMLAKSILKNKTTRLEFGKIKMRRNEILESKANLLKLPSILEWRAKIDLEEGIKKIEFSK